MQQTEGSSGTSQESLIKSVSGEEQRFIKGEQYSVPWGRLGGRNSSTSWRQRTNSPRRWTKPFPPCPPISGGSGILTGCRHKAEDALSRLTLQWCREHQLTPGARDSPCCELGSCCPHLQSARRVTRNRVAVFSAVSALHSAVS